MADGVGGKWQQLIFYSWYVLICSFRSTASCIMEKHGMIHGDINLLNMHWYPDNVAENGDGYGVLVDFDMRCGAAWDFPQRTKEREREEAEKEELEERGRRYDEIRRQTEHDMAVD